MAQLTPAQPTPVAENLPARNDWWSWPMGFGLWQQMRREFDQMLDRWFRDFPLASGNNWRWGLDIQDQPEAYVVTAEAPGFEVGDFEINVTDSRLTLQATRKTETKDREGRRVEQVQRQFYQALDLPDGIDTEKVEAKYVNGILTVTLPKTKASRGRKVPVKS